VSWVDHAIWWQVYPLGLTGAEPAALPDGAPPAHRLDRLEPWLDYAIGLGCNGLALGPVFASETHGYDTTDHLRIDPRLGTGEDFDRLVAAAHGRGLRVLLDGVFNHVGRSFPAFRQALADGPGSPAGRWFRWRDGAPAVFEGHDHLVALNHDEPAVADHTGRVLRHWLDRGADGWRLDAAYAVPADFWRRVLPPVRAAHPDAWFVGEVIHGDYAARVGGGGLDSVTQYELWKAIWSSLNDRNFYELAWALERHNALLEEFVPLTFVGNHDVTRLASRLTEPDHLPLAVALLCLLGGVPSVYYGDEQAFRGVKEDRAGGDDAVRPELPATPDGLPPDGWATYRLHQRLIGLRRRHPWLARSRARVEHLTNQAVAIRAVPADGPGLLLLLNTGDRAYRFPLPGAPEVGPHGWSVPGELSG
jgi:cyclomaltodextrinase